jgi:hypothetical protein
MADVTITLDRNDLGQILDGLNESLEAYEFTARFFEDGQNPDNLTIEEVRDSREALSIAADYRRIIERISTQLTPSALR